MTVNKFVPFSTHEEFSQEEMLKRTKDFFVQLSKRRTVREFSSHPVPLEIIENCIRTAATAPNGANRQPWHFVVVSDPEIKKKIRTAAEKEEREFYETRAPKEWLDAIEPLGTDENKPYLETAPYLIAIFSQNYEITADGKRIKNYYVKESVGIATGLLITAIHNAGLVSLTHTPSPMGFLNKILKRPLNERPFLLLVVGYPSEEAVVPDISKKPFQTIASFI